MAEFWDIVPRTLVEVYQRFKGSFCLYHRGDLVNFYQSTRLRDPEDRHLYTHLLDNQKPRIRLKTCKYLTRKVKGGIK